MPDNQPSPSKEFDAHKNKNLSLKERVKAVLDRETIFRGCFESEWLEAKELISKLWKRLDYYQSTEPAVSAEGQRLTDKVNSLQEQLTTTQQALDTALKNNKELIEYKRHFEQRLSAGVLLSNEEYSAECDEREGLNDRLIATKQALDSAVEALKSIEKETNLAWDGDVMQFWDNLRAACLEYKKSSFPRDLFENYIDGINEIAKAALASIKE